MSLLHKKEKVAGTNLCFKGGNLIHSGAKNLLKVQKRPFGLCPYRLWIREKVGAGSMEIRLQNDGAGCSEVTKRCEIRSLIFLDWTLRQIQSLCGPGRSKDREQKLIRGCFCWVCMVPQTDPASPLLSFF